MNRNKTWRAHTGEGGTTHEGGSKKKNKILVDAGRWLLPAQEKGGCTTVESAAIEGECSGINLPQNNKFLSPSKNKNIYQVPKTLGDT